MAKQSKKIRYSTCGSTVVVFGVKIAIHGHRLDNESLYWTLQSHSKNAIDGVKAWERHVDESIKQLARDTSASFDSLVPSNP